MTSKRLAGHGERVPGGCAGRRFPGLTTTTIQGAVIDAPGPSASGCSTAASSKSLLPANEEIEGPEARVAGAAVRALADGRRDAGDAGHHRRCRVSASRRGRSTAGSIAASAFALVGESPVDRVIAHYLLRSKTETIPAQFFTSEAEAIEWLGQYTSED